MKKVLSYAWFRSKASVYEGIKGNAAIQFEQFLPLLLKSAPEVWPGWEVWIHIDNEVKKRPCFPELARRAAAGECKLIEMGDVPNIGIGCLWRMRPLFHSGVDVVAMRDIDTIPTTKDNACVEEFIRSGLAAHAIHDNPAHSGLMTGMIAFRDAAMSHLKVYAWEEFAYWCSQAYSAAQWDVQGSEQRFLNEFVLPCVKESLYHHALREPVRELGALLTSRVAPPHHSPDETWRLSPGIGVCDDPKKAHAYFKVEDWSCSE